jgi:hypothetical protein
MTRVIGTYSLQRALTEENPKDNDDKGAQQWKYDRPEYRDNSLRKQRVRNVVDQQDGSTNATIQSKVMTVEIHLQNQ